MSSVRASIVNDDDFIIDVFQIFDQKPYDDRQIFSLVISREKYRILVRSHSWTGRRTACQLSIFTFKVSFLPTRRTSLFCLHQIDGTSVTRQKSPNVYKSCPKMISLKKSKNLIPLQKLPKNMGDLDKLIVPKGFKKLPRVQ